MKKFLVVIFSVLICVGLSLSVSALEYDEISSEYRDMLEGIPEDILSLLPEGVFSESLEDMGGAVEEMSSFRYILHCLGMMLGVSMPSALKMFASLLGIIMLSAIFSSFKSAFRSEALSKAYSFCTSAVLTISIIALQYSLFETLRVYFEKLDLLISSMLPIMGVLYALGGNVSTAVASHASLMTFLTIVEKLCSGGLIYIVKLCTGIAFASGFSGSVSLSGISNFIKKTYTLSLGFLMLIFSAVLSMQSTLTARSDSLGTKATKFVVSSSIPLVGGSVAETLRTVGGSVDYLKGYIGVFGIVLVLLTVLPTLLSVLLNRFSFMAASSVAELLGCESEKKLLNELCSLYGYVAALVAISSVVFIFALTLFVRCTSAIGT